MEASQLRIGNYVYRQSSKLIVDKSSVYQIENVNIQSALKYAPIPLTEEWVLKLGFKNKTIYIKGICLYLVNEGMSGGFQDNEYGINEYVDIKYVHQLQNLYFALTGEELTVNN